MVYIHSLDFISFIVGLFYYDLGLWERDGNPWRLESGVGFDLTTEG